jgi:hypothetical protein
MAVVWHLRSAHQTRARVTTLWPNLVFVITFRKIVPRTWKWSRKLRLAILYNLREKSGVKIKIDKVTVIRVSKSPLWAHPPCSRYRVPRYWGPGCETARPRNQGNEGATRVLELVVVPGTDQLSSSRNRCVHTHSVSSEFGMPVQRRLHPIQLCVHTAVPR